MSCTNKKNLSEVYPVKQGDTGSKFQDHLELNGVSLDLTGAAVTGVMKSQAGTVLFQRRGTVLQTGTSQVKKNPNVEMALESGDLDAVGTHRFEWQVELSTGRTITMPRGGYYLVRVFEKLAAYESSSSSS